MHPRTAAERVTGQLLDLIRRGTVRAGDRLPSEAELSQAFGVSRPIVREALRSMAALGVVETRQGGRCYVTDLSAARLLGPLRFLISLDRGDRDALHRARLLIEPALAADAARRMTQDAARQLTEMASAGFDHLDDPQAFCRLDRCLHRQIGALSGNAFLDVMAQAVYELGLTARQDILGQDGMTARFAAEHQAIVIALIEGRADAAQAAMAAHIISIHNATRCPPDV